MQIYLARPGGPRQGPYTVEQINADLAARKYRDEDFWAWHDGLPSWVPLYSVGGVSGAADTTFFFSGLATENSEARAKPPEPPASDTAVFLAKPPWFDALQQAVEGKAPYGPGEPEVDTVVLLDLAPTHKESQPPCEAQTEEVATCVVPTSAAQEPALELNALTAASREQSTRVEPPVPNPKAPEVEPPVLLDLKPAHKQSQPLCEAQTEEVAAFVAPTSAAEEPPIELSAPAPARVELAMPGKPPAPVDSKSPEPIAASAAKARSSKRRTAGSRRLFLLTGRVGRRAGKSIRPAKTPKRTFTSRKRKKSLSPKASGLLTPWN